MTRAQTGALQLASLHMTNGNPLHAPIYLKKAQLSLEPVELLDMVPSYKFDVLYVRDKIKKVKRSKQANKVYDS